MSDQIIEFLKEKAGAAADAYDILAQSGSSFSVKVFKGEIDSFKYHDGGGVGLRLSKNGRVGSAYCESLTEVSAEKLVERALAAAEFLENEDPLTTQSPQSFEPLTALALPDNREVADKVALAKEIEATASAADARIFSVPTAAISSGTGHRRLINSQGLDYTETSSGATAMVQILAEQDDRKKGAFNYWHGRNLDGFTVKPLVDRAVEETFSLFGSETITSGKYPVILTSRVMGSMLGAFSGIFSAKAVLEGRSLLKDRLGEALGSDLVQLSDQPLNLDGPSARAFDDEGTLSKSLNLIENGVLNSYLHNSVTAARFNTQSTGHGARSIKGSLTVAPSNLILQPGELSVDGLRSGESVVEVVSVQGLHAGTNMVSGDFSLQADGLLYRNGVLQGALKGFTISGNFIDLLKRVSGLANNFEFSLNGCGSANILVDGLTISQ